MELWDLAAKYVCIILQPIDACKSQSGEQAPLPMNSKTADY